MKALERSVETLVFELQLLGYILKQSSIKSCPIVHLVTL